MVSTVRIIDEFGREAEAPFYSISPVFWDRAEETAIPAERKTVKSVNLSDFTSIKCIFTLKTSSKAQTFEALILNENGAIKHNITNRIGSLNRSLLIEENSGILTIDILNNEVQDININLAFLVNS